MSEYLKIFCAFFKVGLFSFGGGAAMVPFFRQELIEKNKYITEDELMNYYALGQCTPGIIAVNVATFTGYKILGITGAVLSTLAVILPSVIIILILAGFLQLIIESEEVSHIFAGIRIGVVALIFNEVIKMFRRGVVTFYQKALFAGILAVLFAFHISPITAILLAFLVGVLSFFKRRVK